MWNPRSTVNKLLDKAIKKLKNGKTPSVSNLMFAIKIIKLPLYFVSETRDL